jgi:hypothetical protein
MSGFSWLSFCSPSLVVLWSLADSPFPKRLPSEATDFGKIAPAGNWKPEGLSDAPPKKLPLGWSNSPFGLSAGSVRNV